MRKKCLNCNKEDATYDQRLGFLPCEKCLRRQAQFKRPDVPVELTTAAIRDARKEYKKDIIQPLRDGEYSKEYIEAYGSKHIKATGDEIKKARPVWSDLDYYK